MMNFEAAAIAWLTADTTITATVAGNHPADLESAPWVRVWLIDDLPDPRSPALHFGTGYLQADCYASAEGGQSEAADLSEAVRARLHAMPGTRPAGVVTAVTSLRRRRLPDSAMNPARERYIVTATVHGHG